VQLGAPLSVAPSVTVAVTPDVTLSVLAGVTSDVTLGVLSDIPALLTQRFKPTRGLNNNNLVSPGGSAQSNIQLAPIEVPVPRVVESN
jgi:hypothetical protein